MAKPRKTPTKEQKEWMKESGYTEAQLDSFWAENVGSNPIITNLDKSGMSWRDLNLYVVKKLPTQKQRDEERRREKLEQERLQAEEAARKEAEERYYREHFDEIMVKKIDDKDPLTEHELSSLVCEFAVDSEHGDNRRWSRTVTTIVKLCGRFFSIDWEEGLTECQENEFYNQPFEVRKETHEETITVTEWVKV